MGGSATAHSGSTMLPPALVNARLIVDVDDMENLLGLRVFFLQRDGILVALRDDNLIVGVCSLRRRTADIPHHVLMGHDEIREVLNEAYERATRGLWIWRIDAQGRVTHFDKPADDVNFEIPIEEIEY